MYRLSRHAVALAFGRPVRKATGHAESARSARSARSTRSVNAHEQGADAHGHERVRIFAGNFAADGNASDSKILARAVIALHEHADGVAAIFFRERAR